MITEPGSTSKAIRRLARSVILAATLAASTAAIPLNPALAENDKTITAVMYSGLRVLDPVITTDLMTRNHAYMIYDVLVAIDENFTVQPQMADFRISDDGLTYTFTLRDGLVFHDGKPVTGIDVVASLHRWGERDAGGQLIFDVTGSLEATDEKTVVWTLKQAFPPLLDILGKQSSIPAFIMPERVAKTPTSEAITEYVGSGPFVFVQDEFQPSVSATYVRFKDYVPRKEAANWMSGGKVVNVDRVRWVTMPDGQTALNALVSGEIDYLEQPPIDLLPILKASSDVVVEVRDPLGKQPVGRMNFKHPPFDNKLIRQAALKAISQEPVLATLIGNPDYYSVCGAVFGCGTPFASETGSESLTSGGGTEQARALLEEAGYDGTPVVIMQPTDVTELAPQPVVVAQQLRAAGFKVDLQAMDWQSVVARRANQASPSQGGWSMFFTYWIVPDISTPISNTMLNGRGDQAWFGWPEDIEIEELRAKFVAAATPEAQKEIVGLIQTHVLDFVNYVPLGQYNSPQARRSNIVNMIPSPVPVFWQIDKID